MSESCSIPFLVAKKLHTRVYRILFVKANLRVAESGFNIIGSECHEFKGGVHRSLILQMFGCLSRHNENKIYKCEKK